MTLAIIDTSTANIASVCYALDRLNADYRITKTPEEAKDASKLILPGVGAAASAMARLDQTGWSQALKTDTRPLMGVCLGMQLLFDWSDESDCALLGLIPGRVERLDPKGDGPWPHMGWNTLTHLRAGEPLTHGLNDGDHVYFVHGFYVPVSEHTLAQTQYGNPVTAMVRKGHVTGCQFHPERSAQIGARILKNFLDQNG